MSNNMVNNFVFVRQFTVHNYVSVTFDMFGLTVKELETGNFIQRCDNVDDLYPILPLFVSSLSSIAFVVVSLPIWHRRLVHPGSPVLQFLNTCHFITSSSNKLPTCNACLLGKHVVYLFLLRKLKLLICLN